jgi:hypothetical protein
MSPDTFTNLIVLIIVAMLYLLMPDEPGGKV